MKTLSLVEAVKIVSDTLTETQELIKKIPDFSEMKMKVSQTDGGYKFYFKFNISETKEGIITPTNDYWFTWLTTERSDKLTTYAFDAYNYIMRNLYPNDLMFIKLPS